MSSGGHRGVGGAKGDVAEDIQHRPVVAQRVEEVIEHGSPAPSAVAGAAGSVVSASARRPVPPARDPPAGLLRRDRAAPRSAPGRSGANPSAGPDHPARSRGRSHSAASSASAHPGGGGRRREPPPGWPRRPGAPLRPTKRTVSTAPARSPSSRWIASGVLPQLAQLAEDQEATPRVRNLAQETDGEPRRLRAGVVAVEDPVGAAETARLHPQRAARGEPQAGCQGRRVAAQRLHPGQRGKGGEHAAGPEERQRHRARSAGSRSGCRRATSSTGPSGCQSAAGSSPKVTSAGGAPPRAAAPAPTGRAAARAAPSGASPSRISSLAAKDRLARTEVADVGGADVGDERRRRSRQAREERDLPGVVHPHLDDGVAVVRSQAEQGPRDAEVVVEVPLRGQHRRRHPRGGA